MKKTFLIALLVGIFGLFGVYGVAAAGGVGSDCGGCSAQSNNENLAKGKKLTLEAIEHAKQGRQAEALAAVTEAKVTVKLIVSGQMQKAKNKARTVYELDDARRRARDGKLDEAIAFMEKALPYMDAMGTFE